MHLPARTKALKFKGTENVLIDRKQNKILAIK